MAKKYADLRAKMSPEARALAAQRAQALRDAETPLRHLRLARGLTQVEVAALLHTQQPAVAKLEQRTNLQMDTLRRAVEALGGTLEVRASFPDGKDVDLLVAAR